MSNTRALWVTGIALFCLSCGEAVDSAERPTSASDAAKPSDGEAAGEQATSAKRKRKRSGKFGRQRDELDETVWSDEVAAQEHEGAFVRLWDAMRAAKDPTEILLAFRFAEIEIGEPAIQSLGLEHEAQRSSLIGPTRVVSAADFRVEAKALQAAGWRVVESEWHHSRFVPAQNGAPASSEVSFLLHAEREQERALVKGTLGVTWTDERDEHGDFVPQRLTVVDTQIDRRSGEVAFARVQTLAPKPSKSPDPHVQPVLVEDLDGDGRVEILLAGAKMLYRNHSSPGKVVLEGESIMADARGYVSAAALGDVDQDGILDLVVGISGGDAGVYRGRAGGGFAAAVEPIPLPEALYNPFNITLGDVDGDGDLDAWITQYKRPYVQGQMPTPYYDANDGFPAFLVVNDGKGNFHDATEAAGLAPKRYRRSYASSFLDLDEDTDLDLLVVSDFSGVDVYENDGEGKFTDVTADAVDERASFGMSHTVGDYDLDGRLDLYVVGMSSTTARRLEQLGLGREEFAEHQDMRMKMAYGNRLYAGIGDGKYRETSWSKGTARSGWSWGSTSFDFDNDGDLDIYVANGFLSRGSAQDYCTTFWTHDIYTGNSQLNPELTEFFAGEFQEAISNEVSWNGYEHNKLYVNAAAGRRDHGRDPTPQGQAKGLEGELFTEMGWLMGVALEDDSRAVVSADVDGDGRLDLIVGVGNVRIGEVRGEDFEQKVYVLRNATTNANHWIGVRFTGKRSPIGARVLLHAASGAQERRVMVGDSYQAQHASAQHFGLGASERVDEIEIRYADGKVTKVAKPPVDQWVEVR